MSPSKEESEKDFGLVGIEAERAAGWIDVGGPAGVAKLGEQAGSTGGEFESARADDAGVEAPVQVTWLGCFDWHFCCFAGGEVLDGMFTDTSNGGDEA